jgi:hypothetical protein
MRTIILLCSLFLISCGQEGTLWNPKVVKVQKIAPAESELYTYEFSTGNCTTGKKEFYTLNEACSALLDEKFNNYCQKNQRHHLYETNC